MSELRLNALSLCGMHWIYDAGYNFGRGIPFFNEVHGFVLDKPARIRNEIVALEAAAKNEFQRPKPVRESELEAIHDSSVLATLRSAPALASALELPALAHLPVSLVRHLVVKPQLHACGGTAMALQFAAEGEWAFNLGGGFHHARPGLAHGFCLINDVAWGIHQLRQKGNQQRILILDLDLHQGDGNAAFFHDDDSVFTASLHQEDTFPSPKLESDLDVGLMGRETGDTQYARALRELLKTIRSEFSPELIVYVAGTDPFEGDGIGEFHVSKQGLLARDRQVAKFAQELGASLVATTAGGYSKHSPELAAKGFAAMATIGAS